MGVREVPVGLPVYWVVIRVAAPLLSVFTSTAIKFCVSVIWLRVFAAICEYAPP